MTAKRVVRRLRARRDIEEAVRYYAREAGEAVALGFIEQLQAAFDSIARKPAAGAARYAHELNLPGLRMWPVTRYPHLVFYIDRDDHIDVWRVLHGQRDVPAWMGEPEGG